MEKIINSNDFNNMLEGFCETKVIEYNFDIVKKEFSILLENVYEDDKDVKHKIELKNVGAIFYDDDDISEEEKIEFNDDFWLEFSEFAFLNKENQNEMIFKFSNRENYHRKFNVAIVFWYGINIFLYAQIMVINGVSYDLTI
ncbi:hypothetical protein OKW22_001416 [Bacilli bacterium PM5-3]|nr:hypothetical protein [Bacilli bacterium PM5-3]